MTVLLYIFAAIGAVVTICGIIALGFDISQTRDDMTYYLHTRFPELEKEIAEKLAAFEAKLNNEGFVHKDQYDEDWHQFNYCLNTTIDNIHELDKRLDVVADENGGLDNRMDEFINDLMRIIKTTEEMKKNASFNIHDIQERLSHIERTYIPKPAYDPDDVKFPPITGNSPYDIRLTEMTVGDDPNQMSKGTTV